MGHENSGMIDDYYRPWVNGEKKIDYYLVNEFLKASDYLSIQQEYRLLSKVESLEEKQNEITSMKIKHEKEMSEIHEEINVMMSMIRQNPKLASVKPESLKKKLK